MFAPLFGAPNQIQMPYMKQVKDSGNIPNLIGFCACGSIAILRCFHLKHFHRRRGAVEPVHIALHPCPVRICPAIEHPMRFMTAHRTQKAVLLFSKNLPERIHLIFFLKIPKRYILFCALCEAVDIMQCAKQRVLCRIVFAHKLLIEIDKRPLPVKTVQWNQFHIHLL